MIDLVVNWTRRGPDSARMTIQKLVKQGMLPIYDKVYINAGPPTPVVTRDEWQRIRQHIHCRLHMATPSPAGPSDLYIMQYSGMGNSVKI